MKVLKPKSTIKVEGALSTHHSTIKDDELARGELSKVLRDGVYLDKPLAAVRETITNASDEHRRFKIDRPVEVTLPTSENNYRFVVRDFAKGLPHEAIESVFFDFFNSTKRNCTITTGCKGLGSKAIAALTNEYTVTSWHEG